jgi:hypothetical protein
LREAATMLFLTEKTIDSTPNANLESSKTQI